MDSGLVRSGRSDRLHFLTFGPFKGYYFKPVNPENLGRLQLVCFNEDRFYTNDLPGNAKLYSGEAVFAHLPDTGRMISSDSRINPVFFAEAPASWKNTRPEPREEFVHFHSCYDANGPAMAGFWFRHVAVASFTYDMGGRVTEESPLFHQVPPGPDRKFAKIIEGPNCLLPENGPHQSRRDSALFLHPSSSDFHGAK